MSKNFGIMEIGSSNTKTHVYEGEKLVYEDNTTIEFKKNYKKENKVDKNDLDKLFALVEESLKHTEELHVYGCSIFRNITKEELDTINRELKEKHGVEIEVVSQENEAKYTAIGCYQDIDYDDGICVFIGGGGSIELIFINKKEVVDKMYYDFGVVDVTNQFPSLKDDVPSCSFDEVYDYIDKLIGEIDIKTDVLILAGGDHPYWYNNAQYELEDNTLYSSSNQKYMLTKEMSDKYDKDSMVTSLDRIKNNSDNPLWFDGARAMKMVTNVISNKIDAKYIIPTKINMEDGLRGIISNN